MSPLSGPERFLLYMCTRKRDDDMTQAPNQAPIHPSERVEMGVCDSDDRCVTPGQRRKLNVYWAQAATGYWAPVLATCKGCTRRGRKLYRAKYA